MQIDHIRFLQVISQTGSINLAGEKLNYQSQKLYRIINKIEQEYNLKIFHRSPQGVSLTEEGYVFLKEAEKILEINDKLHRLNKKTELSGTLRIGFLPTQGCNTTTEVFKEFMKNYPQVNVQYYEMEQSKILTMLEQGELDVVYNNFILPYEVNALMSLGNLESLVLGNVGTCVLAAADSKFASRCQSTSLKAMVKYPVILQQNPPFEENYIYRLLSYYGKPKVQFASSNMEVVFNLLKENKNCFMLIPNNGISKYDPKQYKIIPIRDNITLQNCLLMHKGARRDNPIIQTFCDVIVRAF